jgi:hypothetical protein
MLNAQFLTTQTLMHKGGAKEMPLFGAPIKCVLTLSFADESRRGRFFGLAFLADSHFSAVS